MGAILYIYFAPSDGEEDWKNNLNFPARVNAPQSEDEPTWFAHRGFWKVWQTIEDYVVADIMDPAVQKIILSGYSHGAALALLCHESVWRHRPDLRETMEGFGFGCPRVVFGISEKEMEKRWDRFTVVRIPEDIVTHLPPRILGFRHVGQMLEICERGKYSPIDAHRPENILAELLAREREV